MRFALVFVLTTLVATCGQKGPLELPERAPETSGVLLWAAGGLR